MKAAIVNTWVMAWLCFRKTAFTKTGCQPGLLFANWDLNPCYSKCSLQTSSIHIRGKRLEIQKFSPYYKPTESGICLPTRYPGGSITLSKFKGYFTESCRYSQGLVGTMSLNLGGKGVWRSSPREPQHDLDKTINTPYVR